MTVSKGRAPLSVPRLVGKDINEARATLSQLGLQIVEQYEDSPKPKDQVLIEAIVIGPPVRGSPLRGGRVEVLGDGAPGDASERFGGFPHARIVDQVQNAIALIGRDDGVAGAVVLVEVAVPLGVADHVRQALEAVVQQPGLL